ncbi:hypothetical protein BC835DRAFT_1399300 [Cytidiella melzeri]|nr:hypothetical protein BC835DRAFT_1399300 [Cytidiella melzeri]
MRKMDWQISIARVLVLTWCANTASGCSISVVNDAEARSSFVGILGTSVSELWMREC